MTATKDFEHSSTEAGSAELVSIQADDWSALVTNDEINSSNINKSRKKRTLVDSDDNLSSDEMDVQRKSLIDPVLNSSILNDSTASTSSERKSKKKKKKDKDKDESFSKVHNLDFLFLLIYTR